jgi:hypothetical protein
MELDRICESNNMREETVNDSLSEYITHVVLSIESSMKVKQLEKDKLHYRISDRFFHSKSMSNALKSI